MAPKRARADKSVLSRQEIQSRRKAISEKKMSTEGALRRAIIGVFIAASSVLAIVSLWTFSPFDRVGPGFRNAVGPMGHIAAETLYGALGVCAYVLPASGVYASMVLFVGAKNRRRWPQLLSAALLAVAGAVLADLTFRGETGWAYFPGGALGASLGRWLTRYFSTIGTLILVGALCITALIVGTRHAFLKVCAGVWAVMQWAGRETKTAVLGAVLRAKESYQQQRKEKSKQKLEEAAFLAQLEADEEELDVAELAAEEADAVAEEAERSMRANDRKKAAKLGAQAVPAPAPDGPAALVSSLGEPAWVSQLAPKPTVLESGRKKEKRAPNIVTGPAAPAPPKAEAADLKREVEPPSVAPPAEPLPTPGPPTPAALARMPLIVEPKAPPTPTAPAKKKDQEQFEFVGDRKSFTLPPLDVLEADRKERSALDKEAFLSTAEKLRAKLADFGIVGEVVEIRPGPVVTMYEFLPGPGIKVSKIASLADDLAMAMEAMRVRIVAPIPGKGVVGIEVPNKDRETVFLKEIAEQDAFTKSPSKVTMCLGKDIEGMPYVLDLAKAPHLLIAGTTGSGKSVAVNSMIMSILLKSTPEEVRFIMVDPKMLELSVYEGIPHLLLPVVTDPKKAALALRWAVEEMERRYQLLSEAGVRNIAGYNKLVDNVGGGAKELLRSQAKAPKKRLIVDVSEGESEDQALERAASTEVGVPAPAEPLEDVREPVALAPEPALDEADLSATSGEGKPEKKELKKLPYIVVIIDELADLMMVASREVETYIARLAQMARAAGIHLMVATQRPSTDVVTGVIKANFPTRISFMLRSKPDSMTILGTTGAEALLGMGDMLLMPPTSANMVRVHGAYVSEGEIKKAVDHLKAQGKPVFDDSILKPRPEDVEGGAEEDDLSDELYDQALAVVSEMRNVSISMLQRKMRIGYNRAARMIERMEREGIVGPADGAKPREVLLRPVGEMPGAGA